MNAKIMLTAIIYYESIKYYESLERVNVFVHDLTLPTRHDSARHVVVQALVT